jgi:predicted RNase H-like HicB family nuclease
MGYAIVIEKVANNYSAYVPDLPGCVATGGNFEEVQKEIREVIIFHVQGLREHGIQVPEAASQVNYIEIAA